MDHEHQGEESGSSGGADAATEQDSLNQALALLAEEHRHLNMSPGTVAQPDRRAAHWARLQENHQAWLNEGGFFQGDSDRLTAPQFDVKMMPDHPDTKVFFGDAIRVIQKASRPK